MTSDAPPGPLSDVRVLEFAQVMAVPTCGLLLADLGADVIKVEPPRGDSFRLMQPTGVRHEGKSFVVFNRGKRSVCLDLRQPESRSVVERLVRGADVALVSLKRSDLPRYGLEYERFRSWNPQIVYLENTPYGPEGPLGADGGYDVVVQGISGAGAITAADIAGAPRQIRPAYADMGTGFLSALGVVAALRHRDRKGHGQRVETSLLSTAIALGGNVLHRFDALDSGSWAAFRAELAQVRESGGGFAAQQELYYRRLLSDGVGNIYFRHYRTRDGFVSVGCLTPGLGARLRKVISLEDPRQGEGFDAKTPEGFDELQALVRRAEDLFRVRTTDQWIADLRAAGVPCGPFNFPTEVFDDEQVRANDYLVDLEHPALGRYQTFAPPIRMGASPVRAERSSPLLGEHTDEVLEELGLGRKEISSLRACGAIGTRSQQKGGDRPPRAGRPSKRGE